MPLPEPKLRRDEEPKMTREDVLRQGLEAVQGIAEKMSPYCETVSDLIGMVRLALENDGQFRMLAEKIDPESTR